MNATGQDAFPLQAWGGRKRHFASKFDIDGDSAVVTRESRRRFARLLKVSMLQSSRGPALERNARYASLPLHIMKAKKAWGRESHPLIMGVEGSNRLKYQAVEAGRNVLAGIRSIRLKRNWLRNLKERGLYNGCSTPCRSN